MKLLLMRLCCLLLLLSCLHSTCILAQNIQQISDSQVVKSNRLHVELTQNFGQAVANQPNFPATGLAFLTEFSLLRECYGSQAWHQYYNFPVNGVTFIYGTTGNTTVLGNYAGVLASFRHENNKEKKFRFRKKVAFGFAYFDKPYNGITNPKNEVIGSRITAVANVQLAGHYYINPTLSMNAGAAYYHFSNSHYQLPNLGLNAVFLNVGFCYFPSKVSHTFYRRNKPEVSKRLHLNVKTGLGINERGGTLGPTNGPKYPIYLISIFATRQYAYRALLQAGVEANYNSGAHDFIVSNDIFSERIRTKSCTSIFFLGHEFLWKHLSFVVQGGVYLYNPLFREILQRQNTISTKEHLKSWFTTKFGFQYYLNDNYRKFSNKIYIGSYVKANLGQADYWENSIGFCF